MPDTKTYKAKGEVYEIPNDKAQDFLKDFPDAVEVNSFTVGKDTFDIPIDDIQAFIKDNPQAQPLKKKVGGEPSSTSSEDVLNKINVLKSKIDGYEQKLKKTDNSREIRRLDIDSALQTGRLAIYEQKAKEGKLIEPEYGNYDKLVNEYNSNITKINSLSKVLTDKEVSDYKNSVNEYNKNIKLYNSLPKQQPSSENKDINSMSHKDLFNVGLTPEQAQHKENIQAVDINAHNPKSESTTVVQPQLTEKKLATEAQVKQEKEQTKKDVPVAIENTAKQFFKNTGVTPTDYQLEQKKNELAVKKANGDLALYYDKYDGDKPKLGKKMGALDEFAYGFKQAVKSENEADKVMNMSDADAIKYFNDQKQAHDKDNSYLKSLHHGGISETLGASAPTIGRGAAGAFLGGLLAAGAPETGGLTAAGLPAVTSFMFMSPELAKSGYKDAWQKYYYKGQEEGLSDEEAIKKAKSMALVGEAKELLIGAALADTPFKLSEGAGVKNVLGQALGNEGKSLAYQGGVAGAGTLAEAGVGSAKGYKTDWNKEMSEAWDNASGMMKLGAAMFLLHHPMLLPKYGIAQVKEFVSRANPEDVAASSKTLVEKGAITQDEADQVMNSLNSYKEAKKTVPGNMPEEKAGVITGLVEKKQALEKQKEGLDKNFHEDIDKQIAAIDQRIQVAKQSSNPLHIEVDDVTGEAIGTRKTFDDLSKAEREGVQVPKEYGTAETEEVGEGEEKRYKPVAIVTQKKGVLEVSKKIETEDKTYKDKADAQAAAEQALGKHYYENELPDNLKPIKKDKSPENTDNVPREKESVPQDENITNNNKELQPQPEQAVLDNGENTMGGGEKDIEQKVQTEEPVSSTPIELNPEVTTVEQSENQQPVNKSETPVKDEFNSRIDNLDKESKQSDVMNLSVGDYVNAKGERGKSSQVIGFVKKIGRTNVTLETFYQLGSSNDDGILQDITVKKSDIAEFYKSKGNAENKGVSSESQSSEETVTPSETPLEEPKTNPEEVADEPIQFRHEDTEARREELGLEERTKRERKSMDTLEQQATEAIKNGYNIGKLMDDVMDGTKVPNDVERAILSKYGASLEKQLESQDPSSPEFDTTLKELTRLMEVTEKGGSEAGAALNAAKITVIKDDSLAGFFVRDTEANLGAPLTENQKASTLKEYEEITKANKAYEEKIAKLQEENAKLLAEQEVKSARKPRVKKSHEDYAKERSEIVVDIRGKLKRIRQETNFTIVPYAHELIAISPDVAKYVKSLVEEGIDKLEDIVSNVHDLLKEDIKDITKKDVIDLIAGKYNEKKQTKNEIVAKLRQLKSEAALLDKIEKLQNGVEPKSEKEKIKRNQLLESLKKQVREHDLTRLATSKQIVSRKIEKLKEDLNTGNFVNEIKKQPVKPDSELIHLRDRLFKLRQEREARLLKLQYANRTRAQKIRDAILEVLNVPRTLMSSVDFSAPLRQGLIPTIAHPKEAVIAAGSMFKSAFSKQYFDRWFHDLYDSPGYHLMRDSKLYVADPHNPKLSAKEEAFMNNLAEKIPLVGKLISGSERAYVMYLNKMRVDLFNRGADILADSGYTFENNPKEYKALASWINNSTGRGGMSDNFNRAAPILNSILFSPRLISSRLNLLGLSDIATLGNGFYSKLPKPVRMMAIKDMAKFIGFGVTVLAISQLSGAEVELDPRSTDFGKIKVGNTRYDIWGGFQPYIRVMAQLLTGQRKFTTTKDIANANRKDVLETFLRGKLAPVPSMGVDFLQGKTLTGQDVTIKQEAAQHLLPLLSSDIYDAMQDGGIKSIFTVGIPSTFGVSVQTYQPAPPKDKSHHRRQRSVRSHR